MEITNEMVAEMIGDEPGWCCQFCKKVDIDPRDVTFDETHVGCWGKCHAYDYTNDRNDAQRVVGWVYAQSAEFRDEFAHHLCDSCDQESALFCGLLATPQQICEAAVRAWEECK